MEPGHCEKLKINYGCMLVRCECFQQKLQMFDTEREKKRDTEQSTAHPYDDNLLHVSDQIRVHDVLYKETEYLYQGISSIATFTIELDCESNAKCTHTFSGHIL